MHLVAALASGVKGAENGTAEIYQRGTTTLAAHWDTFEGEGGGAGIIALDSYGATVTYVDTLCNVIVKTSGGAVLREFVAGARDDSVEVQSDSFTGSSYDGGITAPGQPTTLGSVLDRWAAMNGAPDWQVALPGGGGPTTISSALAGSYGLVFNVRAYGAIGDGIANDTSAINAAITAAEVAGGIVYLPPGIYRTSGAHSISGDVSLIGAGISATAIVLDNPAASRLINLTAAVEAERFSIIANFRTSSTVPTTAQNIRVNSGVKAILYNLYLDGTNISDDIVGISGANASIEFMVTACVFVLSSASIGVDGTGIRRGVLRDCRFITPATYTAGAIVRTNPLEITGCVFVNTATTTGTYACVRVTSASPDLRVIGCKFLNAAGATVTAIDIGTYDNTAQVFETANTFGSTVTAYAYSATAAAKGANVVLQSRTTRALYVTDNTAAPVLPIDQYGLVVLTSSNAAIVFQASAKPPDGATGTIVVSRSSGTGTAQAGANFLNAVATASTAAPIAHIWEYRCCIPIPASTTIKMALSVDGRSLGASL